MSVIGNLVSKYIKLAPVKAVPSKQHITYVQASTRFYLRALRNAGPLAGFGMPVVAGATFFIWPALSDNYRKEVLGMPRPNESPK